MTGDTGGGISGPMDDAATAPPGITNLMQRVVTASTKADVSIILRGIPANVGAARRFARASLAGCPRAEDLVLAVSEYRGRDTSPVAPERPNRRCAQRSEQNHQQRRSTAVSTNKRRTHATGIGNRNPR
jgi:hypothetical protein